MLATTNTNFTDICKIKSPCVPLKCSIEGIWFADIKHNTKLLKESKKFRADALSVNPDRMGEVELDQVMLVEEVPLDMDDELNNFHLHLPMDVYTIEDKEVVLPNDDGEQEVEAESEMKQEPEQELDQQAEQMVEEQEVVNYGTTDPAQLLKSLSPMLGTKGEIRDISEVPTMTKLMKEAEKLVTKCVYSNILRATSDVAILEAFVSAGGWDILNDWLQEAKTEVNDAFLRELLKVYSQIPITVNLLKQNACAKTIKQLSKSDTAGLKTLAAEIVDRWMSTVRQASGDTGSSEKSKKRKHSHRDKDRSEKDKKSSSKDSSKDSNSKSSPDHKSKSRISPERDAAPASPPTRTKPEPSKPRAKTVKAVPTKFRSTGLEQETVLPPTKMKGANDKDAKSLPLKRPSLSIPKPSPPEKKARPSLPSPLPSTTPVDKKGGVKFIAPRPKPVQVYESAGFMDALAPTPTVAGMRRKRKGSGSGKPPTPTSPPGTKQPSVPSFYQDTLESAENEKGASASPDNREGDDKENSEGGETESTAEGETTTAEPTMPRKKRKKVSWAEEANLKSFFYFELDETERVNVNKQKDFAASLKDDMRMEREVFGAHKRPQGTPDALIGGVMWRRPRLIAGLSQVTEKGCNSTEKKIQKEREEVMLQALYFSKSMIPDSAAEPDPEAYEPMDPKNIPLEDETGSVSESVFTEYPKPVETADVPMTAAVPAAAPGLSLHPDIAKMVASMAQQSQLNDRAAAAHEYTSSQHVQPQQYGVAAHNGAYNTQQYSQGNGMSVPPPTSVHNIMNMAPPPGYPPNYAPPGYTDTSGPPPPYGHPPPDRPPPYGPPPHMQGMHPRDEEWGENMHGGPMMGPGPRGPPPGMPPRGYGSMRRGPPGPPRGRGPPGPPRVCQHFMKGTCKFEKNCRHLHPGINGPRL